MPDDGDSLYAQQRRAPILRIIRAPAEIIERALRKHVTELRRQAALDRLLQHPADMLHQSLADLQRYVPDEPVAHDHIHVSSKDVAPLDVPHEIQRRLFQPARSLARQFVSLHFFFADR